MLHTVGVLLVLHTLLKILKLGTQVAVDDMIEETNVIKKIEFTGKALSHSTTTIVCFLSKKNCSSSIIPVSINLV